MTTRPDRQPAGAIILAAGSASRMGRIKQLLAYGQETFVEHAANTAREAGFTPIVVVLGAESQEVRASLSRLHVQTVENEGWQLGMGSSIACGMKTLLDLSPDAAAASILVADQPLVTSEHLRKMHELLSVDCSAVAAQYGCSIGVPAIFKRKLFSALLSLPPEAGAKHILRASGRDVIPFPLPEAAADIDTPEDYARLTS